MPQASWQAASDGRYWLHVAVGNQILRAMIDLGMVDPLGQVGLEIDPRIYHQIKRAGGFPSRRWRERRDASGRIAWTESGLSTSQLIDPASRQAIAPVVQTSVSCGSHGVPSRVGVVFFHRLAGCRVIWELDVRTWTVEYP